MDVLKILFVFAFQASKATFTVHKPLNSKIEESTIETIYAAGGGVVATNIALKTNKQSQTTQKEAIDWKKIAKVKCAIQFHV